MKHDLSRTRDAIAAYDAVDALLTTEYICLMPMGESMVALKRLDDLAELVGIAYGEDTSDVNSSDTCRKYIRPGHADSVTLSFVRRMVADWTSEVS